MGFALLRDNILDAVSKYTASLFIRGIAIGCLKRTVVQERCSYVLQRILPKPLHDRRKALLRYVMDLYDPPLN